VTIADVDDRGRVVIPKDLRQELGIRPGAQVRIERGEGGIVIRPQLPMREHLAKLKAAFAALPKTPKGRRGVDPMKLKEMWTEKLPKQYR
jgi:AbrB family looped-hinge helix DNA binding protein